jgi:hypothetical protein
MTKMVEPRVEQQPAGMTPERAQVIVGLFRAAHPSAAAEIGHFVDTIIHRLADDVTDLEASAQNSGEAVSPQAAQAAAEFVMAAMLMASR